MTSRDEEHLALANRHIIEGELRVAQQEALIAKLGRAGYDTTAAEAFLASLTYGLVLMRKHRQLILDERAAEAP